MATFAQVFERWFPGELDPVAHFHHVLQEHVGEASRMLDLGCGDNRTFDRYRNGRREVWGSDFEWHPDLAEPRWFRPLGTDGTTPYPDDWFDVIGSCWVLEHVTDPDVFLNEVKRILRPGGMFIGLTVNAWHYVTGLIRTVGLLPHSVTQWLVRRLYGRAEHDTFPTVYRMNTASAMRRLCRRHGLELVAVPRIASSDYFRFQPLLGKSAVLLDWTLDRLTAELGRLYFVAVLRKPAAANGRVSIRIVA
jgi:SAM-dependent methyltransferase